ncbi:Rossmann-fold NAD(P)-binding domain-containing protein [Enterovibrio coralii]|uniref:Glyoxylate/hydroxypyruvate reductase A n=1 Tax=Enterovibrio coralii TaxID=294935 RepID=A0A135I8V8_9GAMM|nr:hypothetical protein [Enterovibrio coralii]KXF81892.1 hypothetical protein ATN88_20635 [Enterovibrio coralii]
MAILLNNVGYGNAPWLRALQALLPDEDVLTPDDDISPEEVEFALVWDHPLGDLHRYPNLKAILLLGAGTEHIDRETCLPPVPVVRLIDPDVVMEMARYALYWVLHFHRALIGISTSSYSNIGTGMMSPRSLTMVSQYSD